MTPRLVNDNATPAPGGLASVEELIEEARAGRMFILVDDEDRENEGDIIVPADACTPEVIAFMARQASGLICLALDRSIVERLELEPMARNNGTPYRTAFTTSIEAREGIETGISAADRAHTVATAIRPDARPRDIVSPGHMFPLTARDGGVLMRAGHTEAAVDFARLAGRTPAAVICEVMKDDGSMARLPDLLAFAAQNGMKVGTIADLIAWRRRRERLVERVAEHAFDSHHGGAWTLVVYENSLGGLEQLALVKGDLTAGGPVPVRMHVLSVLDDVLGDLHTGRGGELQAAMQAIAAEGRGAVVLLRPDAASGIAAQLQARSGDAPAVEAPLRDYGLGAQILRDLGVREMVLLSNSPIAVPGLDGYGLTITGQRAITVSPSA